MNFSINSFTDLMNELYKSISTNWNSLDIFNIIQKLMFDSDYMWLMSWHYSNRNLRCFEWITKAIEKEVEANKEITPIEFENKIVRNIIIKKIVRLLSKPTQFDYYVSWYNENYEEEMSNINITIKNIEENTRNIFKELNK